MNFDTKEFEMALYRECADSFATIIREHSTAGIYLIGLYHSGGGSWGYLSPIVHTHQGLNEAVREYLSSSYGNEESEASLRRELKWSSCDMPEHCNYEDHLATAERLLREVGEGAREAYRLVDDPEDLTIVEAFDRAIRDAITRVLTRLEQDQLYAPLGNREDFVVAIVCGDEGIDDKYRAAIPLNPDESLRELAEDAAYFEEIRRRLVDEAIARRKARQGRLN